MLGKTVYVMAPKTIYRDEIKYCRKVDWLKDKYPAVEFILPHNLFKNNQDWLEKLPDIISKTDCGILLTNNGIIGIGCYLELTLLRMDEKPVYLLYRRRLTANYTIHLFPEGYWHRYAKVKAG
ncbi:MAG: hypothetical protein QXM86_00150 [Candidatus Bathyarchaeia archaeon]